MFGLVLYMLHQYAVSSGDAKGVEGVGCEEGHGEGMPP